MQHRSLYFGRFGSSSSSCFNQLQCCVTYNLPGLNKIREIHQPIVYQWLHEWKNSYRKRCHKTSGTSQF